MKKLSDIAWDVTEEQYRADPALSYSTLAKYEREGFNNLDKLFDRIETPSLTFGSAVDSIITGGKKEFLERFMVASFPSVPNSIVVIVKDLFNEFGATYRDITLIPNDEVISKAGSYNFQPNWRPETRAKVIKEKGFDYYTLLYLAGDKTILDVDTYKDVCNAVDSLKTSEATKFYFADNNPFKPEIKRFYQLKFKGEFNGVHYRNMADLIVVDHEQKLIIPVDLKTSSHTEWDFYKSFIDWRYEINNLFIN